MGDRLKDKVAIVAGGGQTPGETVGNGRAISVLFAREGARVFIVDKHLERARDTLAEIEKAGGQGMAFQADITSATDNQALADKCVEVFGCIDVLVNVVGIGTGDNSPLKLTEEAFDNIFDVNIKGIFLTCKHVLPQMIKQQSGSIINISSIASVCSARITAYKTSKSALNSLTHTIALGYARHGIRANAIMPGLLNTPMAIEGYVKSLGIDKEKLIEERNKAVPLKGGMGDAWDTAYASLFLASDEAKFITSVIMPVDGGQSSRIG